MKKKLNIKELGIGFGAIALYYALSLLVGSLLLFLFKKININVSSAVLNISLYLIMCLVFVLIFIKSLIKDFKDFKKNYKKILSITIKYWIKGLFLMFVFSYLIALIHLDSNYNQDLNIALLKKSILIESLIAMILAPILEEIVFRRSFRNFTNNKHIFAFTTGFIFAMIHVVSSINGLMDLPMLLYLLPYGAVSVAFGYAYAETDNIYGTMCVHSLHNAISILELLIVGGIL